MFESLFSELSLQAQFVHLWLSYLSPVRDHDGHLEACLSEAEVAHADRFIKESDRQKYIAGRVIVRNLLARYLGHSPEEIVFLTGTHGKPYLKNFPLHFNFSHVGDYLLLGVTRDQAIGVDIEHHRDSKDHMEIAKRFFAPSEYAQLIAQPVLAQTRYFYQYWTLKEAFIKATGQGLSFGLSNFEVSVAEQILLDPPFSTGRGNCLLSVHGDVAAVKDWTLQSVIFPELPNYFGAFCVEGQCNGVKFYVY
ncbi:MAG: 4'-phosphopantetheinyl transferase superfamily protein [Coxiellaceae bacterium]|nr:4'-phosphopantetheinyl transferase superfamily protein [Coxiellaceae bacterium]